MKKNPLHPKIPIEIDGNTFYLRYEYRDFAMAEGLLGFPVYGPPARGLWDSGRVAYINGVLLFIGLMNCAHRVHDALHPQARTRGDLTLDDVFGLITHENAHRIEAEVAEAFRKFVPDPEPAQTPSQEVEQKDESPLVPTTGGPSCTPSAGPPSA